MHSLIGWFITPKLPIIIRTKFFYMFHNMLWLVTTILLFGILKVPYWWLSKFRAVDVFSNLLFYLMLFLGWVILSVHWMDNNNAHALHTLYIIIINIMLMSVFFSLSVFVFIFPRNLIDLILLRIWIIIHCNKFIVCMVCQVCRDQLFLEILRSQVLMSGPLT